MVRIITNRLWYLETRLEKHGCELRRAAIELRGATSACGTLGSGAIGWTPVRGPPIEPTCRRVRDHGRAIERPQRSAIP
jgi:hypothetical protein